MTKTLAFLATVGILSVCAVSSSESDNMVGTANPASVFCGQQGGKSMTRKDNTGGEYGVCVFSDGKETEEWVYFRQNNPQ